jgi:hypothetical protein
VRTARIGGLLLALALVAGPAAAAEGKQADGAVVNDILEVLKERGIVDEGEYQRMAAKNARYEQEKKGFAPKIDWWGDFRFRHESFFYNRDATGSDRNNRYRIRYRFRLNGKVNVNEYADVIFRLSSGDIDDRSTNQTLGGSFPDFARDGIQLDRAYAKLTAPENWMPSSGKGVLELGRAPNPFTWKVGRDYMLWDHDINLEGVSFRYTHGLSDQTRLFANTGYYIIDENSKNSDPHMWAIQGGAHHELDEDFTLGGRTSYYEFRSVDGNFIERGASGFLGVTSAGGNVRDGIAGGDNGPIRVFHLTGYAKYGGVEDWPMMFFGEWSKNFEAVSSAVANAGSADTAWGTGIEIGDKRKLVKLGFGWYHIEANAFPAQFIDSDLFDGKTNREGAAIYASRTIMKNTDANLTLFYSDVIDSDIEPAKESVTDSDRVRIQADLVFKF